MKIWIWVTRGIGYGVCDEHDMAESTLFEAEIKPEHIEQICILDAAVDTAVALAMETRLISRIKDYGCVYGSISGDNLSFIRGYDRVYYLYDAVDDHRFL